MKIAFLFPGQGAQKVGMGKDLYEKYDEVKRVYDDASRISGIDVATLCFNGIRKDYDGVTYKLSDEAGEDLNKTENTQIAIATMSLSILEILKKNGIEAEVATGLSLGEYPALMYSDVIDFGTGINLLKQRGFLMQHKVPDKEFLMLAVIGLDSKVIEEVCEELRKENLFVVPANYNYSGQTVISGEKDAVQKAEGILEEKGAKKVVALKTSGPFHTALLDEARKEYEICLESANFEKPKKMVLRNIDGNEYSANDDMKDILSRHIVSPVRFDLIIKKMFDEGVDTFVEIGPGKTLTGFIKKENVEANVINICDVASLENAISTLKGE